MMIVKTTNRRPLGRENLGARWWWWWCAAILVLVELAPTCHSAPSFNPKPSWRDDDSGVPAAILASSCNPATNRCWGWLPIVDSRLDDYTAIERDSEFDRTRPVNMLEADQMTKLWRDSPAYQANAKEDAGNLMSPSGHQVVGRLAKKDVFMSRGWGAGGMPFSVLYMSPRASHPPPSGSAQDEAEKSSVDLSRKNSELSPSSTTSRTNQSNYRVAQRNGSHNQPRRHYSIIPQLFISYGWGPSGK